MALGLNEKKAIVTEVAEQAGGAISGAVADYRGLNVEEMTQIREKALELGVYLKVVRNTLAKRALSDTEFACFDSVLTGPTMLALSSEEPSAPARLLKDYAKKYDVLKVKALAISGRLLQPEQLEYVAKLPTRDEALATLMQVMKAPITKFVRTVAEPHTKMVRTVAAIRDQKQAAA